METDHSGMPTRVALLEQAVGQIGGDVKFIRTRMESLESLMTSLVRIDERMATQAGEISRAFESIRTNQATAEANRVALQTAIDANKTSIQSEKDKTEKWMNIGIGIWISASIVWILFGGYVVWWVQQLNEHLHTK